MPQHPNIVAERLAHGCLCHVCPLNGQRKVGTDGPVDAEFVVIAEAPGADEEEFGSTRGYEYGRPLVGKTGYFFKLEHLVPAGVAELRPVPGREWPRVDLTNVHLLNVIMCRPPKNKIDTPVGRAAVACCANGTRWHLRRLLRAHPDRMLRPLGNVAFGLLMDSLRAKPRPKGAKRREYKIDAYRERFMVAGNEALATATGGQPLDIVAALLPEPDMAIYRRVLRGRKPSEEWWPMFEAWLRGFLKFYRRVERYVAKHGPTAPEEWSETRTYVPYGPNDGKSWCCDGCMDKAVSITTNHTVVLDILLKKQRAALRKAAKRTNTTEVS